MAKVRLDILLVQRGLAQTRAKAQAAIQAGGVTVGGAVVDRASALVGEDAALTLEPPHPWVSRGGVKLAHALDAFGEDPRGRACLDVGASTGGFTDVLLARGAARVVAVDVGRGQLHARLRADPRVASLEETDARTLTADLLGAPPSLIVADVSFIGFVKAIARPLSLGAPQARLIALIKPQFEAGPNAGKSGVLDDAQALATAERVAASLDGLEGFNARALIESPLRGREGNREFLLHAVR
ncbi:MAG: TlyA family RNA methyltransferase [Hydrogenophilaceae bacterium]|jgi:23S rRNA (cytidine1920-2'-O)/16S rRNA (cytidine1409-2'-O)-methyltransferase|nr:TlyA family RNA methyltransferase [Hydrogenophilaceae bacterium]